MFGMKSARRAGAVDDAAARRSAGVVGEQRHDSRAMLAPAQRAQARYYDVRADVRLQGARILGALTEQRAFTRHLERYWRWGRYLGPLRSVWSWFVRRDCWMQLRPRDPNERSVAELRTAHTEAMAFADRVMATRDAEEQQGLLQHIEAQADARARRLWVEHEQAEAFWASALPDVAAYRARLRTQPLRRIARGYDRFMTVHPFTTRVIEGFVVYTGMEALAQVRATGGVHDAWRLALLTAGVPVNAVVLPLSLAFVDEIPYSDRELTPLLMQARQAARRHDWGAMRDHAMEALPHLRGGWQRNVRAFVKAAPPWAAGYATLLESAAWLNGRSFDVLDVLDKTASTLTASLWFLPAVFLIQTIVPLRYRYAAMLGRSLGWSLLTAGLTQEPMTMSVSNSAHETNSGV